MKTKLFTVLAVLSATAMIGNAAVTLSFATQTGSSNGPNGLPVVDGTGAAILNSTSSVFASIGYLTAGGDSTPTSILSRFNPIDDAYMIPNLLSGANPRNGLFNMVDFNNSTNALPAGFAGQTAVVLIGNNGTNIKSSTSMAMFTFGAFGTVDPVNGLVQTFLLTSASVPTVGLKIPVTTQPLAGNTYVNGVAMVPIPEPSAALLGALGVLGLLRRRRI